MHLLRLFKQICFLFILQIAAVVIFPEFHLSIAKPVISSGKAIAAKNNSPDILVFFKIENAGDPDEIVSVKSPIAKQAIIHSPDLINSLPIPAKSTPALSLDGAYIILRDLNDEVIDGMSIPLEVAFKQAGILSTTVKYQAPSANKSHDHSKMDHSTMAHSPKNDATTSGDQKPKAPTISITVIPDERAKGWLVNCKVTDFRFSKQDVDKAHINGVGHGHLYVDGIKIRRIYKADVKLGRLPAGKHIIRVTLNTNDHNAYSNDGKIVTATTTVIAY